MPGKIRPYACQGEQCFAKLIQHMQCHETDDRVVREKRNRKGDDWEICGKAEMTVKYTN